MTIDEAIERNTNIQIEFLPLPRHRDWEAVQLGIEALKRLTTMRGYCSPGSGPLLPDETKE